MKDHQNPDNRDLYFLQSKVGTHFNLKKKRTVIGGEKVVNKLDLHFFDF